MQTALLDVQQLVVSVDGQLILNGVSLTIMPGELHVLMGPNGTGKSTLVSAVMGDPRYRIESGTIRFKGLDITKARPDERARLGLFLSFQTPQEIPGVTLEEFLRTSVGAVTGESQKVVRFRRQLREKMDVLDLGSSYVQRYLNVGFSGGEKKKTEMLQLLMLNPVLAMLDETDSGLDVDAVRTVATGIKTWHNDTNSLLIITHNAKILEGLDVTKVHVLENGVVIRTGGPELIQEITEGGFATVGRGA